jgi:hypothetical protein
MHKSVIGGYPAILDNVQLKSYLNILLSIAAIDVISEKEMALIIRLAQDANVDPNLLDECVHSYRSFDASHLPDYNKQWAYCLLRDAILIADCDDGISPLEDEYLRKIASFAGLEFQFPKILELTLTQKHCSEEWEALLSHES